MHKVAIAAELVKSILYGSLGRQRFTQDSPVLPEVWTHLAADPNAAPDCLIVPRHGHQAHHMADELQARLSSWEGATNKTHRNAVSDIPGLASAALNLDEVVNIVMPLTRWWETDGLARWVEAFSEEQLAAIVRLGFDYLATEETQRSDRMSEHLQKGLTDKPFSEDNAKLITSTPDSTIRILVLIAMIQTVRNPTARSSDPDQERLVITRLDQIDGDEVETALTDILDRSQMLSRAKAQTLYYRSMSFDPRLVFTLSLNRSAKVSSMDSAATTKADAAYRVFNISTAGITWAVIDSGIDASHPAFYRFKNNAERVEWKNGDFFDKKVEAGQSRVKAKYDLTILKRFRDRDLINNAAERDKLLDAVLDNQMAARGADSQDRNEAESWLRSELVGSMNVVFDDLEEGRPFNWELIEHLLRVDHSIKPRNDHGTHVAGTLGGAWIEFGDQGPDWVYGMCRDIELIDLMVVGERPETTEFAVIAAQRLVRYLNQRQDYLYVHGVNISMSIPHDVTNYACGRTPVCIEAENLVGNRVVVVAAAGNLGFNQFQTANGVVDLHTNTSITDPGNAQAVITVGSTHRLEPHNYGVSYFSSRGPTGDGRMKPDLVAPGEKINAPICNRQLGVLEGTSMSAPHVSGAAAMLMARFNELRGEPQRIKEILCQSATDLGRERAYQGAGLVDVLRALQSI